MLGHRAASQRKVLLTFLLAYTAASLLHYSHNAEFLADYPNLPAWLSRAGVYAAWLGVTAIGVVGYVLFRMRREIAGLLVLGIYAALGLDGLGHYAVAPISAHTLTMNLTIWLEFTTAVLLLLVVGALMIDRVQKRRENAGSDRHHG